MNSELIDRMLRCADELENAEYPEYKTLLEAVNLIRLLESKPNKKGTVNKNASRLSADWYPSPKEADFCVRTRPDLNLSATIDIFRDYWVSVPGAKGCKLDWSATWRNWVRNQHWQPTHKLQPYESPKDKRERESKDWLDAATGGQTKNERDITPESEKEHGRQRKD